MTTEKDKVNMVIGDGETIVVGTGAGNARVFAKPGETQPIKDPIARAPDIEGLHSKAWRCDLEAGRKKLGVAPEQDATLVHWVIEAPWAHPIWHSYSITLVHLRPIEGRHLAHPTKFYLPDATHELWVNALDPEKDRSELVATGIVRGNWLRPSNFAAQIIEISDELALTRIRDAVQLICAGKLSPDTDWQSEWIKLFNNSMIKKEFR